MAEFDTLELEAATPHITVVTLDRPGALNALNTRMAEELLAVCAWLAQQGRTELRAVVLTGAGGRAFCAGADLKERLGMSDEAWARQHRLFEEAVDALAAVPVPVIAAVNGAALGGGCELALACDLIVAADGATFGQPEVTRGIMPGLGGTQRLPRRVGPARAKELLFTGRTLDAREALSWGLVNRVVPADQLRAAALDLAKAIAASGPIAVRQAKAAVDGGDGRPLKDALAVERAAYGVAAASDDRREGVRAFVEKREPRFSGR